MTASSQQTRPLNIVWRRRALDRFLEASFIREVLLASLRRPMRWTAIEDDAVVTYNVNTGEIYGVIIQPMPQTLRANLG